MKNRTTTLVVTTLVGILTGCEAGEIGSSEPRADEPILVGFADGADLSIEGLHEYVDPLESVHLTYGEQIFPIEVGGTFEDDAGILLTADSNAYVDDEAALERFTAGKRYFGIVAVNEAEGSARRIGRVEAEIDLVVPQALPRQQCGRGGFPISYDLKVGCCLTGDQRRQKFHCYVNRYGRVRYRAGRVYCSPTPSCNL